MRGRHHRIVVPLLQRQRGAFAVMAPALILVIMGFCGLAMTLSMMYNRKAELQTAAESIALAAATQLNGTSTGVTSALAAAAFAANTSFHSYNTASIVWNNNAISFAATPYASDWVDASTAQNAMTAANLFYVRVNTAQLTTRPGTVSTLFLQVLPSIAPTMEVDSRAVAGRSSVNVTPLAICAMSAAAGASRGTELVEYGFRRGISYNLMMLNPNASTGGAHYLINPISLPGTVGSSVMNKLDIIRPFVCTGTLSIPSLAGGNITVEPGFPLSSVYQQLNSRFGTYAAPCTAATAPPDSNVKSYTYSSAFPWMNVTPRAQSAETRTTATQLLTIADLPAASIPSTTTADMYGPLWVYAKAAKSALYRDGVAEPSTGYTTFGTSDWSTLYTPGAPAIKSGNSYPTTPYLLNTEPPTGGLTGVANRRVLNVPLLNCPVASGAVVTAEVRAIAKFFMTVPATENEIFAEFAGVIPQASLAGKVELYP
jgi:Flp pilus assembly protein TadG